MQPRTIALSIGVLALLCVVGAALYTQLSHLPPGTVLADSPTEPTGTASREQRGEAADTVAGSAAGGAKFYGAVMDAITGAPIGGASVSVQRDRKEWNPNSPASVTDVSGAFRLEGVGGKWPFLVCRAEGYARAVQPLSMADPSSFRVDFLMQPGAAVIGTVLDASTEAPIPGAGVYAQPLDAGEEMQAYRSVSGEDGTFEIPGLAFGSYRLTVRARRLGYVFHPDDAVTVTLSPGDPLQSAAFTLTEGAVVEGQVLNTQSETVSGAKVSVVPARLLQTVVDQVQSETVEGFAEWQVVTDGEGRFRVPGLDFDQEYRLRGVAPGYARSVTKPFAIAAGESPRQMSLVLLTGSRIAGQALLENGTPANKRQISLYPELDSMVEGRAASRESTISGADGSFLFEHVAAGTYRIGPVATTATENILNQESMSSVTVDGLSPVAGIKITLQDGAQQSADGVLAGTVLDPAGEPVLDARVEARPMDDPGTVFDARTGRDGNFEIAELPGLVFNLAVVSEAGTGERLEVAPGESVTIRLAPPASVSGIVVDAAGAPVPSCAVTLDRKDTESLQPLALAARNVLDKALGTADTDNEGHFRFDNVKPGVFIVEAKSDEHGTAASDAFTVAPGSDVNNIRLALRSGIEVSGVVVNREGQAVPEALVRLVPAAEDKAAGLVETLLPTGMQETAGSATTDRDGAYKIEQVPPGVYDCVVTHADYAKHVTRGLSLRTGQPATGRRTVLGKGGEVIGYYLSGGEPKEGAVVQLVGPTGMRIVQTNSDGTFRAEGLPAGAYLVNFVDPATLGDLDSGLSGLTMNPKVVDIEDGLVTEVSQGPGPGVSVSGTVNGDLGKLTTVALRRPGGPLPEDVDPIDITAVIEAARYLEGQAIVHEDGRFEVPGIPPGDYVLDVVTSDMDLTGPDLNAIRDMDRTPRLRQQISVGDEPLQLNLNLPPRAG